MKIRIYIFILLCIAGFTALMGYLLRTTYPRMSDWLYYLIILGILTGGVGFFLFKKRTNSIEFDDYKPEDLPVWLKKRTFALLAIGTVAGAVAVVNTNKTSFYVDNGTDKVVSVKILDGEEFKIEAHNFNKTSVMFGINEIVVNGKAKNLNFESSGNWVLNVDTANIYLISDIQYGTPEAIKDMDTTANSIGKLDFVRDEFFKADVDYMFDAPDEISIDKKESGTLVTKKVLYRLD